jgi:hypothetical protein
MREKPRMSTRWRRGLAVATALATAAAAQAPKEFATPDGSRFWLVPGAGPPVVHWAIASPCGPSVDPPAAPGLAAACALASLDGTWQLGSLDATREAAALSALDQAESDLAAAPLVDGKPPAELQKRVAELRQNAEGAADVLAFRRVLAGAPATDVAIAIRGNAAVLSLSTTPAGLAAVARLLVDRREGQALRSVRSIWEAREQAAIAAWERDPMAPLRAEAPTLAFPSSPLARAGDRPPAVGCTRPLAQATWARSQHPTQVLHVLTGNFDVAAVQQTLGAAFASTALPTPPPEPAVTPRAPAATRRSTVPGVPHPSAAIGWTMRGNESPVEFECLAHWSGDGRESWLGQQLQRHGRRNIQVSCSAPWPGPPGPGLLLVQATDPDDGPPGLADEILELCKARVQKAPGPGELAAAHVRLLADWHGATESAAATARHLAVELLLLPPAAVQFAPPPELQWDGLPTKLQQLLDGNPVVVEGRNL